MSTRPDDCARADGMAEGVTTRLVLHAQHGDAAAIDALLQRCLPRLRRWARGRLPVGARSHMDTCDLVQEVALKTVARLPTIEANHQGAIDAYLRQGVMNRVRDELRRAARRPRPVALPDQLASHEPNPYGQLATREFARQYQQALQSLTVRDRRLVIARLERGWGPATIAKRLAFPSPAAAGIASTRAVRKLASLLAREEMVRRVQSS